MNKNVIVLLILVNTINVMGQSKESKNTETSHSYSVSFNQEQYADIKKLVEEKFSKR